MTGPMSKRIQVVVDDREAERYRRQAAAEGLSLSAWLRRLARERLDAAKRERGIESVRDLEELWKVCDSSQSGREPDWDEHLEVIRRSRRRGSSDT